MTPPTTEVPAQRTIPLFAADAKVYPRSVSGRFANWRWIFVALTQLFFYGMPWLQWNGRQALLFDIEAQRFYVLGLVFYPQDLIYLAALLVLSALALFLFTAVAGRLWCGYSCPQTVYTELFLWIERRTEGDRQARIKLDAAPWGLNKLLRKGAKQAGWVALALFTGFSFVGYFSPIRQLAQDLASFAVGPWNLFWILFYAGATYGNAGYLREQMCKYICPYARFQSALIDADSLIIGYDTRRGEPRGARSKKSAELLAAGVGDCVDCTLCVQVCPTGIDIRKGLQNECIGCAACIDACDQVMDKIGAPRGLIRYATENGMKLDLTLGQMLSRVLRPRVLIYASIMAMLITGFGWSLAQRQALLINVIKDRNTLARQAEDGSIENSYRVQLMNRSEHPLNLRFQVDGLAGLHLSEQSAAILQVPPAGIVSLPIQLQLHDNNGLTSGAHPVRLKALDLDHPGVSFESKASFYLQR